MSAEEPLFLGLDCSTHGAKAIAWSARGDAVAQAAVPFELHNPRPGWWEQDAQQWVRASLEALGTIGAQVGSRVVALGITHQRETFVGVDEELRPVRPAIVWMDERSHEDVACLRDAIGAEDFHRITGKPLSLTPSISKIHWIRRVEPANFDRVHRWLDVQALLVRHLTGEDGTSVGSADPMGLVDIERGVWSDRLLGAAGVQSDRMAKLAGSGSVIGRLLEVHADATGLSRGVPVVVTAGDGQVAAVGAGIRDLSRAYLNLGTAIVAGTVSEKVLVDRAFRTMSGAQAGTFLLESDLKGGTFTLDWLFERILGSAWSLRDLESEAARLPAGAGGLILVPYLATVMDPYWDDDASGVLFGLRGDHGPAHVFRAIVEGIALEERLHFDRIERAAGTCLEAVHVLGGGASSELWCQILADVLDRLVVRTRSLEATSLGAAMLASAAVGAFGDVGEAMGAMGGTERVFEPGPNRERYARLFEDVFLGLYPALQGAMGKLARFVRQDGEANLG